MTFSLYFLSNPVLRSSKHHFPPKPEPYRSLPKITSSRALAIAAIPARDRVIDFGKYKGKMLGTLPSDYLKWISKNLRAGDFKVSKNLRARDFEDWAKLADQVLEDPVYKDRFEWDFAQRILNGDSVSSSRDDGSAVSDLLEVSETFGWDFEDKEGWGRVNLQLLGTSKGGRIPRIGDKKKNSSSNSKGEEGEPRGKGVRRGGGGEREEVNGQGVRRGERRDRMRLKRGGNGGRRVDHLLDDNRLRNGGDQEREEGGGEHDDDDRLAYNPFPGREALMKKVLDGKRGGIF
ncbi:hypothetical protein Dimus_027281 [Dionaea muscipula]